MRKHEGTIRRMMVRWMKVIGLCMLGLILFTEPLTGYGKESGSRITSMKKKVKKKKKVKGKKTKKKKKKIKKNKVKKNKAKKNKVQKNKKKGLRKKKKEKLKKEKKIKMEIENEIETFPETDEYKVEQGSEKVREKEKIEKKKAEEAKRAEEAKKAEEAKRAEEAKKAEEAKRAEEAKKAEEAKRAEEAKKAEEAVQEWERMEEESAYLRRKKRKELSKTYTVFCDATDENGKLVFEKGREALLPEKGFIGYKANGENTGKEIGLRWSGSALEAIRKGIEGSYQVSVVTLEEVEIGEKVKGILDFDVEVEVR